ncbi:MAG: TIGR02281 family clan AA aspartic protease [Silicimonas sp.]|nr:TIGR02281 family clan AA aspartic protease [Silicimonas sp.]
MDELAQFLLILVLGTAVAGWLFTDNRNFGKVMKMSISWGLIFLGTIAAIGLWDDTSRTFSPRQSMLEGGARIEVPRDPSGHFNLVVEVNGVPVDFLVDTGATDVVLTMEDAARVGLNPQELAFIGSARTANGTVRTASARVDNLRLGKLSFDNARVSINGGEMDQSLLGMSFLGRVGRLEIANNMLILEP